MVSVNRQMNRHLVGPIFRELFSSVPALRQLPVDRRLADGQPTYVGQPTANRRPDRQPSVLEYFRKNYTDPCWKMYLAFANLFIPDLIVTCFCAYVHPLPDTDVFCAYVHPVPILMCFCAYAHPVSFICIELI